MDFALVEYWTHDAFANRERERERKKMHQTVTLICMDAIHSPNALKERTRLYRYIKLRGPFSAPILSLPLSLRSLFVEYVSWRRTILNDSMAFRFSRLSADFIANRIVRFKLDSLDSIKAHLPENHAKDDRECVRAAINNHAPDWSFLDLRASGPLVIRNLLLNGKNHFRKLDGPRTSTVKLYNLLSWWRK